jgi:hypothetical protein
LGLVYNIVIEDLILYNIEDVIRLPWSAVVIESYRLIRSLLNIGSKSKVIRSKIIIYSLSVLIVASIIWAVLYIIIRYILR